MAFEEGAGGAWRRWEWWRLELVELSLQERVLVVALGRGVGSRVVGKEVA